MVVAYQAPVDWSPDMAGRVSTSRRIAYRFPPMELSGIWRAALADDELRRVAAEPDFDDDGWASVTVPGHWRNEPAFAGNDAPVLHRRRFEHEPPAPGDRHWLRLDGIFYQGDLWLDGTYLGDTEGYFVPHRFEVTEALAARTEHLVTVETTCSPQRDRKAKRNLTGVFQHWDCIDPDWNPGGIWRPVGVDRTGPVAMTRLRVLCREADASRAVVAIRAELDTTVPRTATVTTQVAGVEHRREHSLASGTNRIDWTVTIERPTLWWPWSLGDQPLHDVCVSVDVEGERSDERTRRIGLRSVSMRNWIFSINGERLFLKGANQGPTRPDLGAASPAELERDVVLAKEAGLDLLRMHGHIGRTECYEAADRAGMLVWQDMPLQWGYARTVRRQAQRQAREAVDLLGHHPSIIVWCGHNEPFALDVQPGTAAGTLVARQRMAQQLPTWNKTFLDTTIRRALSRADQSRPVVAHSGVHPHLPKLDGTDSHLYFGWYHGDERELSGFARAVPRQVRFVSEFGAQAIPDTAGFMEPERWPDLDWQHLETRHGLQRSLFDQRVPAGDHASFEAWRDATQRYQAELIRRHIETLRRLKYRPTGGFAMFSFADTMPMVSWSVLDHARTAKLGHQALVDACRPVIVVADRLPAQLVAGDPVALDVHVVSDLRTQLDSLTVTARMSWNGGSHAWAWRGAAPADACVRIGTVRWIVPANPGPLRLDLDLVGPDVAASNRYDALVT